MPEWTPEQADKIDQILEAIKDNQIDIKDTQKTLNDLVVIIKGYNGFKGIAQTVQENATSIIGMQNCMGGLEKVPALVADLETKVAEFKNLPSIVKELDEKVTEIRNKPGDSALKWFTRIGVALLSALCIGLFTYLFTIHSVTQVQLVDPNTPYSQHVLPGSTQHPPTTP
jgi:hypothetical protein